MDTSSVAKRSEEIEMEENTAYGPIGSAGAHPTTTQAPVVWHGLPTTRRQAPAAA